MMFRLEKYLIARFGSGHVPWLFCILVLATGLVATYASWQNVQRDTAEKLHAAFESSANNAAKNIRSRLDACTVVMLGIQGFFNSSENVTFDEFYTYVQALNVPKKLPGIQGIGLAVLVNQADKDRHVAEIRKQKFPNYQIHPEGTRANYAPIIRIEPLVGDNLKALGFDTFSLASAKQAMELSRDQDDIAITSRITLIQDRNKANTYGFVMYLPIYKKGFSTKTVEDRRQAVSAWVDMPFRLIDLMAGLHGEFDDDIFLGIYDGNQQTPDKQLYQSPNPPGWLSTQQSSFHTSRQLDIGGRQWTLAITATPAFIQRVEHGDYALLVMTIGTSITLCLSMLTYFLSKGRYNALSQYRQLFEQAGDSILLLNRNHRFIDANPAALKLLGCDHTELLTLHLPEFLPKSELAGLNKRIGEIMAGHEHLQEWTYLPKNGSEFTAEVSARRLDGNHYLAILRDLTERKKAEQRIQRLTHLYQALSETNQAIVRMVNKQDLFPLVCRCAVDFGGMEMAWIGQLNPANASIFTASAYGSGTAYLDDLALSAKSDVPEGQGPTGIALRENRPIIINDYLNDPKTRPWHERARTFGWGSAASFPIQRNGKAFAVLNVYHAQVDAFDAESIKLLAEMAGDVCFALDNFDREYQRTLTEQALADSEHKLSVILDNVSAFIFLKDTQDNYLYVNRPLLDLWQTTIDQVLGFGDEKFFDAASAARIRKHDLSVLIGGQTIECEEADIMTKTGKLAAYWTKKLPLYRTDGRIYALCGISNDITERKKAEIALREGEARYRLLFTANPVPMWVYDINSLNFIAVNDAAIAQYGYSLEELLNMQVTAFSVPELPPAMPNNLSPSSGKDDSYHETTVCRHCKKDGSHIWVEITGHVLNFEGREAEIILAHDISKRVELEQQLHLNAQVFESSGEGIMITDSNNKIISVNRAYTDITGWSADESINQTPRLIASGEQGQEFYQAMWQEIVLQGRWQGEVINRRKNGEYYPQWLSVNVIRDQSGEANYHVGILSDLSEYRQAQERIQFLSYFDTLTQLPNRLLLRDRTQIALATARREQCSVALMYIDLDRFKIINDSLGQQAGDQLLMDLATRLTAQLHPDDTLCRQGGDEFILLLPNTNADGASLVAKRVLDIIAQPFLIGDHKLNLTTSIGVAEFPQDGDDFEQLAQSADAALFRAKQNGRNNFQFFTQQMHEQAKRVLEIESELRSALEQDQLKLHYQAQADIATGQIIGAEALLRWQHPLKGMISPDQFIPIAEESCLIIDIGAWVVKTAIAQTALWQASGIPIVPISVNLSAVQFRQDKFYDSIAEALQASHLDPNMLELEMTEGIAMENTERTLNVLDRLNGLGVSLAMDDFGTGYSSLSYLKRFKINKLKIDQSFIRDLGQVPEDAAIITAIISMSKSLGFKTIAEGVETRAQLDFLREKECDEIQGYYFSKPIPAAEFASLLISGANLNEKLSRQTETHY